MAAMSEAASLLPRVPEVSQSNREKVYMHDHPVLGTYRLSRDTGASWRKYFLEICVVRSHTVRINNRNHVLSVLNKQRLPCDQANGRFDRQKIIMSESKEAVSLADGWFAASMVWPRRRAFCDQPSHRNGAGRKQNFVVRIAVLGKLSEFV